MKTSVASRSSHNLVALGHLAAQRIEKRINMGALFRVVLLLCLATCSTALKAMPRRAALRIGAAALTTQTFAAPAFAKMSSAKAQEIARADQLEKDRNAALSGLAKGAGGKGLRGTGSAGFDENDTVQKNRSQNGGLARDANGKKVAIADRNPDPASLGLKQWNGEQ